MTETLIILFIKVITVFTQVRKTMASQQHISLGEWQGDINLLTLTVPYIKTPHMTKKTGNAECQHKDKTYFDSGKWLC